jgi:hypothetical protein
MTELGPAPEAPSTQELIQQCGAAITTLMKQEMSDESDSDRVWVLRKIHKSYLYYRDLQSYAPQLFQSIVDFTGVAGPITSIPDELGSGLYDYTQNFYRGYARKLEALLGNRMPNCIAMPNSHSNEEAIKACTTANNAALYIRQHCDLQMKNLYLVFGLYNFGTMFWHIDYVRDGAKYGFTPKTNVTQSEQRLGDARFTCPECATSIPADAPTETPADNPISSGTTGGASATGAMNTPSVSTATGVPADQTQSASTSVPPAMPPVPPECPNCGGPISAANYQPPTMVPVPVTSVSQQENGSLEISLHDASEISVPLNGTCCDTIPWLRWERDRHKGELLLQYEDPDGSNILRDSTANDSNEDATVSGVYAESIRSAMASPIGLVRPKPANYWTVVDTWWTTAMFELIDDKQIRAALKDNFKRGLRITSVKGRIIDLQDEKLSERWQECKPEPSNRIMGDALGDDWLQTQDILNNTLNQCNETIDRSNQAGYGDPTRIDFDALQNRRSLPGERIPALRPAGGSLQDILYDPPPIQFSEQIPQYRSGIEQNAQDISGLTPPVWGGGDAEEPTARQAELKKNAALMQLGVPWTFIGKALERVYMKSCKLLSEFEDGVLAFTKKNQFGKFTTLAIDVQNLRSDTYHFEADEAIPMSWGQERDLLLFMLDKPAELLNKWGFDSPLNIFEFKQLLSMPGEHIPGMDQRDKCMDIINQLAAGKPVPGPADPNDPTGAPGPLQSSIQPAWEDDVAFAAQLIRAWLVINAKEETDNPDGIQNIRLYGQACEAAANKPAPAPPPKASVAVAVKPSDIGNAATQALLDKAGLIPDGTPVGAVSPPPKLIPQPVPSPGANGQPQTSVLSSVQ